MPEATKIGRFQSGLMLQPSLPPYQALELPNGPSPRTLICPTTRCRAAVDPRDPSHSEVTGFCALAVGLIGQLALMGTLFPLSAAMPCKSATATFLFSTCHVSLILHHPGFHSSHPSLRAGSRPSPTRPVSDSPNRPIVTVLVTKPYVTDSGD